MKFLFPLLLFPFLVTAQEDDAYYEEIARRDSIAHTKHIHPLPVELAGIGVGYGVISDSLVTVRHGKGLFFPEGGHGGSRYWTDPQRKVIMKIEIGVDSFIEFVGFTQADYPYQHTKGKKLPVSKNLSDDPKLIKGIKLGDSPETVMKAFGVPNKDVTDEEFRSLVYIDDYQWWPEVLFYDSVFEFRNNKLVRISIYNGE